MTLANVPSSVANSVGQPQFGTYAGSLSQVDLTALRDPYQLPLPFRLVKHKRWVYSLVATPEVVAAFGIVDLSYARNAFVVVCDLASRRLVVDASLLGPPGPLARVGDRPGEGLDARFLNHKGVFSFTRPEGADRYVQSVRLREGLQQSLSWKGELLAKGGAPALTVIAPVAHDGVVNVTQKWAGLLAFGQLEVQGRRYVLDGGVGGMDYSHGYLARTTAWRWALACGRLRDGTPVGVNLVEGFNDSAPEANENAAWVGNELFPLGRARFDYSAGEILDPWRVRTDDGAVDLAFKPIAAHREARDLGLLKSRFVQPMGRFSGTLRVGGREHRLEDVAGVTEDQDVLW